ncbi:alpha/beta fold hydrolase [Mycolicibacterium arseniciresistens]|uniref:Alpha/beta fold hydrolase n=1 Tax=Mycolicibacterium arseniciresistens TaxID=3062257 RepID=A0ABT8UIB4_9MYCO|nr:alpha/beta fold hydrolase [Mycolicibacterium arseniciresistens]MDO3636565.1 alpha/beta fold hydrolase [Mycolicibacterium arseniciresistens]
MHFRRYGSGPPLLLVHGISQLHNWDPVVPALAARHEVVAVDLPGFGASAPLPGEVTVAALTDAVQDFVVEQDLGDVSVVGSSMGARIALEMARRGHGGAVVALNPGGFWTDTQARMFGATVGPSLKLVRAIDPLIPALAATPLTRTALLLQFSARPWRLPADLVRTELRAFKRSTSLDAAMHALVHGPRQQGAPAGTLRAPVVIGWGRKDRVTPPSQAARAQERFPDATMHWFDDCGHFPHWDRPHDTVQLILDTAQRH